MNIKLIQIQNLHTHESVDTANVRKVINQILKANCFKEPIIVDREHLVVLDGHHRLKSCQMLGLSKIPCMMVNYLHDKTIRVESRRQRISITKNAVIDMALSGNVFPHKTTRHFIPHRIKKTHIPLLALM
jgi:ParB-like nuclease domain